MKNKFYFETEVDKDAETALHFAASSNKLQVVDLLLRKGANIDAKDNLGKTALHIAVSEGRLETVKILLKKGANIKALENDGKTALHIAACDGKLEIIDFLLQKGADIEAQDNLGQTALHNAVSYLDNYMKLSLDNLLNKDFDIKAIDINSKLKILDLLIKKDAASELEFMRVKYFNIDALRANSGQIKQRLETLQAYFFKMISIKPQSFSVHSLIIFAYSLRMKLTILI